MRSELLKHLTNNESIVLLLKNGERIICKLIKVMHHLLVVDSDSACQSILLMSQVKSFEAIR